MAFLNLSRHLFIQKPLIPIIYPEIGYTKIKFLLQRIYNLPGETHKLQDYYNPVEHMSGWIWALGVNTVQSRRTLSGIVEQCKVISDDTCSESWS